MSHIRLYVDEDAMQLGLVAALRTRRIDVIMASDANMINRCDEDHLSFAASGHRVLYSFNIRDYAAIHEDWLWSGKSHAGIILALQQRYSVGEQLRRLLHLANRKSAAEMIDRVEYLSAWSR